MKNRGSPTPGFRTYLLAAIMLPHHAPHFKPGLALFVMNSDSHKEQKHPLLNERFDYLKIFCLSRDTVAYLEIVDASSRAPCCEDGLVVSPPHRDTGRRRLASISHQRPPAAGGKPISSVSPARRTLRPRRERRTAPRTASAPACAPELQRSCKFAETRRQRGYGSDWRFFATQHVPRPAIW